VERKRRREDKKATVSPHPFQGEGHLYMRAIVIILAVILLFISQINTVVSVDLWWILKSGEYIVENLRVPHIDIFSYTLENRPWLDHEWLSQALFYLVFSWFGLLGLSIFKALIVSASFLILLFLILSRYKKIALAILIMLISILAFGYRSFLRPEIFSYLFLCIFLYILEREKNIYILPVLQILWVNLHGYFIVGPIIVLLYSIGDKSKTKKMMSVFFLLLLACFINPYFYRGALYPLRILFDVFTEQKIYMKNIHELMMPIRFSFNRYLFFWLFAIFTSITFIVNLKRAKIKHIVLFALCFLASYMAMRNAPIFIFLGMITASINLNEANSTKRISGRRYNFIILFLISGLIYFFLSDGYYKFTNQSLFKKTGIGISELLVPAGACDFLEDNNIEGRMFNTMDFGSYIGYRFFPERRIFIDTRTDLYKDDFYTLYAEAQHYPEKWHKLHERYGFKIVLLRHLFSGSGKILRYLYDHKDWRLAYYDENSCVFLSDDIEDNVMLRDSEINIRIARFFDQIGETGLSEKIYIKLLKRDPEYLEAGNNLAAIYINSERYEKGMSLISRLLKHHPKSAQLYANLGTAYLRLGKVEKACLSLEKAARLNLYLRKASYLLGLTYLERNEIDEAKRQFVKYTRLDPYDAEVHRFLGDIYTQKGLLQKAFSEYNEADALEGL